MKIKFVSQASLLIETTDCKILTDPWYMGTAFNDAWKLFPAPNWNNSMLDEIQYLWISHEHPDHFHIPTLKSFPQDFKDRVILLFQKNNTDKMPNAFKRLGFKNVRTFNNRTIYPLTDQTSIYISQIGQMDSSLAVINAGTTILNLNDCEANSVDCKNFKSDLGKISMVFNQFSMAGYNGFYDYEKHLPETAATIVNNMLENHRDLGVDVTVPFASNIYFCTEDNKYMNNFGNTPRKVYDRFMKENLKMIVLYADDTVDTEKLQTHSSEQALSKFDELYSNGHKEIDTPPIIELAKIKEAVKARSEQLHTKFPKWFMKKLQPVNIKIPDLDKTVTLCLDDGTVSETGAGQDFDLVIFSQPLFFSFNTLWGVQTMGVGARFRIKNKHEIWKWYRIITSLNNAEMYLKFKYLFTKDNVDFLRSRMKGGVNQLMYQLKRMSS